jgi:hypothetical protein
MNNSIGQRQKNYRLNKFCPMLLYFLIIIILIALFIIFFISKTPCLKIVAEDNSELLTKKDVWEFQITHIHSVAKSLVKDFYEIHDFSIINQNRMEYHDYGAGLPTNNMDGNFQIADGKMVLTGLNYEFPEIRIMVGRYSDQKIIFTNETIALKDIANPGQMVILKPGKKLKIF